MEEENGAIKFNLKGQEFSMLNCLNLVKIRKERMRYDYPAIHSSAVSSDTLCIGPTFNQILVLAS